VGGKENARDGSMDDGHLSSTLNKTNYKEKQEMGPGQRENERKFDLKCMRERRGG